MPDGYARRAKFATTAKLSEAELETFKENEFVMNAIQNDNPMVDIPIESVFAFSRIKRPIGLWHFCFFLIWTPIGLPILIFRSFVMFGFLGTNYFISKTPLKPIRVFVPWTFIHVIMPICGLLHTIRGQKNKDAVLVEKCVFVSNHISNFDPLWFNCIFQDFTLLCAGDYDWFWDAMKTIGILNEDDGKGRGCIYTNYFGTAAEREEVKFAIEEDMARDDARPFLIYPEGCVTTGVSAVMQYQKFVFSLDKIVVPICLSLFNPWPYEHYTLSSGAAQHLLWYMFSPFVIMNHAILEPQKLDHDENPGNFALRVQCMTAAHLGLGVIKMNWKQKDRLGQALGFQPYSENIWSRRESMDEFREAIFNRKMVLRDGETVPMGSERKPDEPAKRKGSIVENSHMNLDKGDEGAFLAKEYAARHNQGRNTEMKIFDEAMARAATARRSSGVIAKVLKKGVGIENTANEEYVQKVNGVRRASLGESAKLLNVHAADSKKRAVSVREKRRASLDAARGSVTIANDQDALNALIAKHGGDIRQTQPEVSSKPSGNKVAPAPPVEEPQVLAFNDLLAKHGGKPRPVADKPAAPADIPHPFSEDLNLPPADGDKGISVPAGDGRANAEAAGKGDAAAEEKV